MIPTSVTVPHFHCEAQALTALPLRGQLFSVVFRLIRTNIYEHTLNVIIATRGASLLLTARAPPSVVDPDPSRPWCPLTSSRPVTWDVQSSSRSAAGLFMNSRWMEVFTTAHVSLTHNWNHGVVTLPPLHPSPPPISSSPPPQVFGLN